MDSFLAKQQDGRVYATDRTGQAFWMIVEVTIFMFSMTTFKEDNATVRLE